MSAFPTTRSFAFAAKLSRRSPVEAAKRQRMGDRRQRKVALCSRLNLRGIPLRSRKAWPNNEIGRLAPGRHENEAPTSQTRRIYDSQTRENKRKLAKSPWLPALNLGQSYGVPGIMCCLRAAPMGHPESPSKRPRSICLFGRAGSQRSHASGGHANSVSNHARVAAIFR